MSFSFLFTLYDKPKNVKSSKMNNIYFKMEVFKELEDRKKKKFDKQIET